MMSRLRDCCKTNHCQFEKAKQKKNECGTCETPGSHLEKKKNFFVTCLAYRWPSSTHFTALLAGLRINKLYL